MIEVEVDGRKVQVPEGSMRLGWKVFIPITLVWLVVVAVWMQTPWSVWN